MISIADLVRALHDIDAWKGRTCRNCVACPWLPGMCAKGYQPYGLNDGCDEFQAHRMAQDAPAASAAGVVPAIPRKAAHEPGNEAGEA